MKKVLIHGPILTCTGYGEMARFAAFSLLKHPDRFDVYLNNITWGTFPSWIIEPDARNIIDSLLEKTRAYVSAGGSFDMSIQCTIPSEFKEIAPVNIGYTAGIETTKAHPMWVVACNHMDKIITISSFSKKVLEESTANVNLQGQDMEIKIAKPIEYIGFPAKTASMKELSGLDIDSEFNFLAVGQYGPRKNFDNLIAWFIEKFHNDPSVGLVLKLMFLNNSTTDEYWVKNRIQNILNHYPEKKCPIYLVSGNLTDEEMNHLYQHPKIHALINLSHGEGFGIPMFEAGCNSMPVITCEWGGQTDFLIQNKEIIKKKENGKKKRTVIKKSLFADVKFVIDKIPEQAVVNNITIADSKWCYPSKEDYKDVLGKMITNYPHFKHQAEELSLILREKYNPEKLKDEFAELIYPKENVEISNWLASIESEEL